MLDVGHSSLFCGCEVVTVTAAAVAVEIEMGTAMMVMAWREIMEERTK